MSTTRPPHARLQRGLLAALLLAALLLAALIPQAAAPPPAAAAPAAAAAPVAHGYRDFSFAAPGNAGTPDRGPTSGKPQSKLWFSGGRWWGVLRNRASAAYHIYAFDAITQAWTDTGTLVDERADAHADALWDEAAQKLYIATAVPPGSPTADRGIRVLRYSFAAATLAYTRDPSFPIVVATAGIESVVLDRDSTGIFWIAYTLDTAPNQRAIYVARAATAQAATWVTPYVLPGGVGTTNLTADDIAALVAYNGRIGVMWSNQTTGTVYFAAHIDGAADSSWQQAAVWQGPNYADDHINLKSLQADPSGQVFAAIKTSLDDAAGAQPGNAQIVLLRLSTQGGWASAVFGTVADGHTRPLVLIDDEHRQLYMFAAAPAVCGGAGAIYYKQTDLDTLAFAPGPGTPFIQSGTDPCVNNPTSTKQPVNSRTGLLVAGSDLSTGFYLHNYLTLASPAPSPSASPSATPAPTPAPSPSATPSPSPSASPSATPAPAAVRVRAGLGAYTDAAGQPWAADSRFSGGNTASTAAAIAGTPDPALYQGERWGTFSYAFPLPDGTYTVTLKFAEIYWTQPGQRVFNVALNGQPALTNFDILAQVPRNTALDKTFTVAVTGGTLTVAFTTVADAAKLSAIAIAPGAAPSPSASPSATPAPTPAPSPSATPSPSPSASPSATPAPTPAPSPSATPSPSPSASPSATPAPAAVRVRAGLGAYTDAAGQPWAADSRFSGGNTASTAAAIAGTPDPALYQGERWGTFSYAFPLPDGTYTVTLKFAEIYWTQPGQRVFNVALNGQPALTNFDILAQVPRNTALDKTFTVAVTGGTLTVAFTTVADAAKLSAIAIAPGAAPSPSASPSATPAPTPAPSPSATPSPSPSASPSATPAPTPAPSPSATPSPSPSASPSATPAPAAVRVRAGLGAYTDAAGQPWAADSRFSGGNTASTAAAIAGTPDPALYQGERWGTFSYAFPLPDGTYTVTLKFAEIYWTQPGQRVFNVALNGQPALTNFDILAQVPRNTALDKTFTVAVTGGTLTVAFTTVADAAKLSAIAIAPGASANVDPDKRLASVPTDTHDQWMLCCRTASPPVAGFTKVSTPPAVSPSTLILMRFLRNDVGWRTDAESG